MTPDFQTAHAPAVPLTLDDRTTLCSVEILAAAVDMVYVHGIVELRTLRNALDEAMRLKTDASIRFAYSAFSKVDRDFRAQISHHALTLATIRRRTALNMQ